MYLLPTLALRYLWGRKLRTVLTTLAIVFGVFVIFGMNILVPTMLRAFQSSLLTASGQVDVTVTHKTGESFSPRLLDKVQSVPGVRAAAGSLERTVNIPGGFYRVGQVSALSVIGIDPRAAQELRDYSVKDGRFLRNVDTNAAVITASLAETLGLQVGDSLPLPTVQGVVRLEIIGLRPTQALPGNEPVWITLNEAQKLFNLPNRINTIQANLEPGDPAQRQAVQDTLAVELGPDYHLGALSDGSGILGSLQTGQQVFNLFGFLSLLMGGFIIFNTFRTIVAERRRDIGLLRAIGASRSVILGLLLVEGILQGVIGTGVGMALGYLLGVGIVALMASTLAGFLHIQLGAPVVEPSLITLTIALGVGVTLAGGLLPAWSATRVTPLEALRPSAAPFESGTGLNPAALGGLFLIVLALVALVSRQVSLVALGGLSFLVGLVLVTPALVRPIAGLFGNLVAVVFARDGTGTLAQGNLTRQPSRAAVTASATMIGLAIIVGTTGLTSSLTSGILGVLQKSLGSDYLLMPPSVGLWAANLGAGETLADRLRRVDGVGVVSTMRFASSSLNDQPVSLLGIDPVAFPQVADLNFQAGDARTAWPALAQGHTIIVNGLVAARTGLRLGDEVRLSSPEGEQAYRIVAVAGDYLNAKILTAYTSQANLKNDFHKTEDIFIQFNLTPGADPAQVEPRIRTIAAAYPQFKLVSGKAYFEENRQIFEAVFSFFYVLLAIMALPSLIAILNTLAIGVIERTREIGMLRAIGATRRQVRRTILAEALLLATIGAAFGILAGLYLGYVMVLGLAASGIFPIAYSFPLSGLLAAIALALLFGVLAALLPARQAARMDIIQALRYE